MPGEACTPDSHSSERKPLASGTSFPGVSVFPVLFFVLSPFQFVVKPMVSRQMRVAL